jgi:hypothetical protein
LLPVLQELVLQELVPREQELVLQVPQVQAPEPLLLSSQALPVSFLVWTDSRPTSASELLTSELKELKQTPFSSM